MRQPIPALAMSDEVDLYVAEDTEEMDIETGGSQANQAA